MCFLLLLSGNYGYDRNCWSQATMIINIKNNLPSSSLGSLPENLIGKIIRGEELNQMQRIDWSNASWTVKCYY